MSIQPKVFKTVFQSVGTLTIEVVGALDLCLVEFLHIFPQHECDRLRVKVISISLVKKLSS